MKYVRIPFSVSFMSQGGIGKKEFSEMINLLPVDAKVIGFGTGNFDMVSYIFISSDSFKDVETGSLPPDATPMFKKLSSGNVVCEGITYSKTGLICAHSWHTYSGLTETYEYCVICGEKA